MNPSENNFTSFDYNPIQNQAIYYLAIDIGKVNMGYAVYDGKTFGYSIFNLNENITPKMKKIYGEKMSRIIVLNQFVSSLINMFPIKKVILEQQVKRNTEAVIIQTILETIFFTQNIEVVEFAPINKFKYLNPDYDSKRKEHKKISANYAQRILFKHNMNIDEFNEFKKKDDISDAICMVFMEFYEDKGERELIKSFLM